MTVETLGRAVDLYRRTAASRSAILLVAANLIPLAGVLLFGWSLWTILVLYWVENGIVGLWNVPRILLAQGAALPTVVPAVPDEAVWAASGGDPARAAELRATWEQARQAQQRALDAAAAGTGSAPAPEPGTPIGRVRVFGQPAAAASGRAGLAIFFVMHYGIFWFVHGVFVFALPTFFGDGSEFGDLNWTNVVIAAVALFLSHGASFLLNYIGRAEYLTATPMSRMAAPYGRVVVLHLTIIFGAFAAAALGAPIGALLLLVGLKTAFDLGLHLRERRSADARVPADTPYGQIVRDA